MYTVVVAPFRAEESQSRCHVKQSAASTLCPPADVSNMNGTVTHVLRAQCPGVLCARCPGALTSSSSGFLTKLISASGTYLGRCTQVQYMRKCSARAPLKTLEIRRGRQLGPEKEAPWPVDPAAMSQKRRRQHCQFELATERHWAFLRP